MRRSAPIFGQSCAYHLRKSGLIHEAVFDRRQKVLIIAPATLRDATWVPFFIKNNLRADVLSFEQLVADIEDAGSLNNRMQQLDEYAMVIVDEAHAMRNDKTQRADALRRVLAGNVPKDLVEMTATPVNNSLEDLYHLISYFAPGDAAFGDVGIPSLRKYFQRAIEMDPDALTPEHLFDVMDEVVVRRTRRFVKNHYAGDTVVINGVKQPIRFPTCRVKRVDYNLDAVVPGVFDDLATALGAKVSDEAMDASLAAGVIMEDPGEVLTMARYVPSQFLFSGNPEQYEAQNAGLLRSGLLKRFESSSYAFEQTVNKMITSHARFLDALDSGLVLTGDAFREWAGSSSDDVEDFFTSYDDPDGVADAADYDIEALHAAVTADRELLSSFATRVKDLHEGTDPKVEALIEELAAIAADATAKGIGPQDIRDKRKTLVFTYFADTASYLEGALRNAISSDPRLSGFSGRFTMVSGQDKADKADVIIGFAPMTAGTGVEEDKYDLIIATDVLAEGVNLQQARNIVNYDLPWNPMRLVQRSGRIDRIGSSHSEIFVRCFFPDADLDKILLLEERLKRKLKQAAAAVGHAEVLPGMDPVERVIADTREQIEQLRREEAAIFLDIGAGSLSGEDYRRRLANAFKHPDAKARVLALPWGSGTGFVRQGATPGLVFCARIGGHPKPWFRYIPLNEDLSVAMTAGDEPHPFVIEDTLTCLTHADPQNDTIPANLPEPMYQAAFDAWAVAQEHIHAAWMIQTDPANLAPQIPKVLRDASAFVREHGGYLGETQDTLAARLNAPYPVRVQREVRRILLGVDVTETSKIDALNGLANRLGLAPPPSPPLLPPIDLSDIHLVCWTAISPTPAGTESA